MVKKGHLASKIDVAIITDSEFSRNNLEPLLEFFINTTLYDINNIDITKPISSELMIVYGDNKFINSKKLEDIINFDNKLELLFITIDEPDIQTVKKALRYRAFDIIKSKNSDYLVLLKPLIYAVEKKIKAKKESEYSDIILKYLNHLLLIHDTKKTLFANDTLLNSFNLKNISEADKLLQIQEFKTLIESKSYSQKVYEIPSKSAQDREYIITHQWITPQTGIFTLLPYKNDILKCSSYIHSRVEFIEQFKNAFVTHKDEDESIYILLVHIKNGEQIIDIAGEEIYNQSSSTLSKIISSSFNENIVVAQWSRDLFVILSADISPDIIKNKLDKLYEKINIELSANGSNLYIDSFIIYMNNIDINRSIGMIDDISSAKIVSKDIENIIYSKMSIEQNSASNKDQALYYLEKIIIESPTVKVLNFYKGIRISTGAKLIKLSDGVLYIATEKMQGYAMKLEESVIIQSSATPYDIKAKVKVVDIIKKIAILTDFEPIETSANNRQYIRIQSEHRMHANIIYNKKMTSGVIVDFSIKSMAIKLNSQSTDLSIGDEIELKFTIPIERLNNELISMSSKAKVQFIQQNSDEIKVILELFMQEPYEGYMIEYIYSKQQALIIEIKSIASRL